MTEHKPLSFGWIAPVTLLLFLSALPFLLPVADDLPAKVFPSAARVFGRTHARVVLIIVDGLGYDKAINHAYMPLLAARAKKSAFGAGMASFPTITPSGLRAILSGHRVSVEPQLPTGVRTQPETDSVMSRASASGLKVFIFGQFTWPAVFPGGQGARLTVIPFSSIVALPGLHEQESLARYDRQVLEAAEPVLEGAVGSWDLVILHLFESDPIAHMIGTEQPLYRNHLRWVDFEVAKLSKRLQARAPTTFVLTADHGQSSDGSHGGLTLVERKVPFMMWGAGTRAASLGTFPLYDAAPTISAFLGVPPPAQTEGWPLLAGMEITSRQKADIMTDLLNQRLERWKAFIKAWPWIGAHNLERDRALLRLYEQKKYDEAALAIELHIRGTDRIIENAMPERWLWRLIAAAWLLVLAACFGLAWREVEPLLGSVRAWLAAACVMLVVLPLQWSGAWNWASDWLLLGCLLLASLNLVSGLRAKSDLDLFSWTFLWSALLCLAFQEVLDLALWSWLVLLGIFAGRAIRMSPDERTPLLMSFASAATCALFAGGRPPTESSFVRSLFPFVRVAFTAQPDWQSFVFLLMFVAAAVVYVHLAQRKVERRWLMFCAITAPLALSCLVELLSPSSAPWVWLACLISLLAYLAVSPPAATQGVWLSVLALAYYRTLSSDMSFVFLALAALVGWGLAWRYREKHPLRDGLELFAVGLWAFKCSGGTLTFSKFPIEGGVRAIGGWHPYAILLLLILKQLAAFAAPILPRLNRASRDSLLGISPFVGALSAGNLTMIWWDRFQIVDNERIRDHVEFARVMFVLILTWLLAALWLELKALDWLSRRIKSALDLKMISDPNLKG